MKRIYSLLIIVLVFLVCNNCSDDFIVTENINNLNAEDFYKTAKDFENSINTAYMPIGFGRCFGGSAQYINYGMDDRVVNESATHNDLAYTVSDKYIDDIYWSLYTGVMRTNLFIEKFTDDIKISEDRRKTIKGEAYFLRGLYYFYLASWFEVPPLLEETSKDAQKNYPNATQEELYEFVIKNFEAAIILLPETWDDANVGRATKGAAMAFLGKTYLYQDKFQEAANTFKQLINLGIYSLNMPTGTDSIDYVHAYLSNFSPIDLPGSNGVYASEFNSESIYEISYTTYEGGDAAEYLPLWQGGGSLFSQLFSWVGGYNNIGISGKFLDAFEKPLTHPANMKYDPRMYAIIFRPGDTLDWRPSHREAIGNDIFLSGYTQNLWEYGLKKYLYPYHVDIKGEVKVGAPNFDPNNLRLMRYSDVLLMYAEATIRSNGDIADGLTMLNLVRSRVGMPNVPILNKEAIIHERDIEFAAEQSRFWDLARWYKGGWMTLDEVRQFKPTFQPKHVCFPIPSAVISMHNGVLKQNTKWQ